MFDKFAQIENSLSRKVGGSGLGLPIAKQLIEAHNGAIWCNSKPEKGSSFYFAVPIVSPVNKFFVDFKQNLQRAKMKNQSVALISLKSKSDIIEEIKNNVIKKDYLKDSATETDLDGISTLLLSVEDGDKFLADFLKKRVNEFINLHKDLCQDCDIMYGYGIYPIDALDDLDLIKRVNKSYQKL